MGITAIVYSTKGCIECDYVKQMLDAEHIEYEVRDVLANKEYQQEVEKFGFLGVPVTVVGGKAVKGFNPELKELIELAKK
ncbi:glutaredoxin family protein [Bacillus alkalicellulosilyticus]|uniref:glutaredoxin family protein n=1 Tax=Alkalihalobacterium alkalicellulosilyticum TaxID=1912214 RepID=UPI000995F01B|nr:glutaredoxin family protein [Bacillus alkalicellulosilyticus]